MKFICPCLPQRDAADYVLARIDAITHPLLLFIIIIYRDKYCFRFDEYLIEPSRKNVA